MEFATESRFTSTPNHGCPGIASIRLFFILPLARALAQPYRLEWCLEGKLRVYRTLPSSSMIRGHYTMCQSPCCLPWERPSAQLVRPSLCPCFDHEFMRNLVRTMVYLPAIISPLIWDTYGIILQPQRGVLWQIASRINPSFAGNCWRARGSGGADTGKRPAHSGMTMVVPCWPTIHPI